MKKSLILSVVLFVLTALTAMAQRRTVTGTVRAEDGSSLPGVTVLLKGTTTGSVSDINGAYSISVSETGGTLLFQFVGLKTVEAEIGSRSVVDVVMTEDVTSLQEIVITGYGQQLKTELTGNIAKVSGRDLENIPVPSVEQALQGRAAGVFIEAGNGKVGQGIKMRIRGSSSITASNQPLFVVDGVLITTESQSSTAAETNPLADLNFNDVESIEILKDASAAAIYGSRAANGVVLITTKKGKAGKTNFNVGYQTGVSSPTAKRDFLNAREYVELFREAAYNNDRRDGFDPINDPADYPDSWLEFAEFLLDQYSGHTDWRNLETNTDWQDQVMRTGSFSQFDLNASGGNEKTRFYMSGSYSNQEGILIGNRFERMSGRINLDHSASDKFKFGLQMGLSRTLNDRVADDNAFATPMQAVAQPPITPVRDPNGVLYDVPVTPYYNVLVEHEFADFRTISFRNLSNVYGSYEVIPGLTLRGEFGLDLLNQNEDRFWGSNTEVGRGAAGTAVGQSRWVNILNYTSRAFAHYSKGFGSHFIDATGGLEYQNSRRDQTNVEGQGIPVDDLRKLASAAEITSGNSTLQQFTFVSYFGRINYKFNDRYLLSLSARADGSSRFGENNRFGFFPAASAGWILSEEAFLKNNSIVSFLKLRSSYGLTGNAQIGNFNHLGLYSAEGYAGFSGLRPVQIPNPDLRWEKTAQTDVGIDFGFLNNRITGEIDYYIKKTNDLLLNVPVPSTSGFGVQTRNIGALENYGVEFVLNTNNLVGAFTWSTSFNLAHNQNKVTDLGDQEIIDDGGSRYMNVVKVGHPIGAFFGAEYAGVDPANGDALWYVNGEGTGRETTNNFNRANFVVLGNPNPLWIGGLNNTFAYKGFDFAFLFQFVLGNQIHNAAGTFMTANMRFEDNQTADQMRRWRNPGDQTDVPQARLYRNNGAQSRSSRFLYDGDYLRLKTVTLGYTIPSHILSKASLRSARVYLAAQNLLTFTGYNGWDPEVNTDFLATNVLQGIDFYAAPQARTITFGVNIGF